jgi:hypothetical protein
MDYYAGTNRAGNVQCGSASGSAAGWHGHVELLQLLAGPEIISDRTEHVKMLGTNQARRRDGAASVWQPARLGRSAGT